MAMKDDPGTSDQQIFAHASSVELGLQPMTLAELREVARDAPFEWSYIGVSLIATRLHDIWDDGAAQVDLLRQIYGDVPIIDRCRAFVEQHPRAAILSQQQLYIAQRLLIQEARDVPFDVKPTFDDDVALSILIIHTSDLIHSSHASLAQGRAQLIDVVAFINQSAAMTMRPALMNEFSRFYDIFAIRARDNVDDRVPLDDWAQEAVQLSLEQQLAAGFGLNALADRPGKSGHLAVIAPGVLSGTQLEPVEQQAFDALAAPRAWFVEQFAKGDQTQRDVVWEVVPFARRPFLRLESGKIVRTSPGAAADWVGFGTYDRLREVAKTKPHKKGNKLDLYGQVFGELVESYAVDLVKSVYPDGTVFGDLPYGNDKRTPDIAIVSGTDLVLIEVRSGFLSPWFRTSGDVDEFKAQLKRLVFDKLRQLANRVVDLKNGEASIPGVDTANIERIWPILITAPLMLTEHLWKLIEPDIPAALREGDVQHLVIGDIEDLEMLMGLVEQGVDLVRLLDERQQMNYARLELLMWVQDQVDASPQSRPAMVRENWERAATAMRETLWPDAVGT